MCACSSSILLFHLSTNFFFFLSEKRLNNFKAMLPLSQDPDPGIPAATVAQKNLILSAFKSRENFKEP